MAENTEQKPKVNEVKPTMSELYAKFESESKAKTKNKSGVSSDTIRQDILKVFTETKTPKLLLSAAINVVKELNVARYKDVNYSTFRAAVLHGKMFKMEKDTQERVWIVKV